jgi:hypothetical protein
MTPTISIGVAVELRQFEELEVDEKQPEKLRHLVEAQMMTARSLAETLDTTAQEVTIFQTNFEKNAQNLERITEWAAMIIEKKTVAEGDLREEWGVVKSKDNVVASQRNGLYSRSKTLVRAMEVMERYLNEDIVQSLDSLKELLSECDVLIDLSDNDMKSDNEHLATPTSAEVAASAGEGMEKVDSEAETSD